VSEPQPRRYPVVSPEEIDQDHRRITPAPDIRDQLQGWWTCLLYDTSVSRNHLRRIRNTLIWIAAAIWVGTVIMIVLLAQIGADIAAR
jgi:hypothetical protein